MDVQNISEDTAIVLKLVKIGAKYAVSESGCVYWPYVFTPALSWTGLRSCDSVFKGEEDTVVGINIHYKILFFKAQTRHSSIG